MFVSFVAAAITHTEQWKHEVLPAKLYRMLLSARPIGERRRTLLRHRHSEHIDM